MANQSLEQFRQNFGSEPVEVELTGFSKDALSIFLKPLSSKDRDGFEASVVGVDGHRDLQNLRARLVSLCWVDEKGKPMGTQNEIGELRADFIGAIFDKVRELNGMDSEEEAGKG